jgi:hypothetical protein
MRAEVDAVVALRGTEKRVPLIDSSDHRRALPTLDQRVNTDART